MQSIILKDLRFYAYHGVLLQERKIGAYFIVNLKITTVLSSAIFTDELEQTINYAEIYECVKKEMTRPSKLLEHVAGRIILTLFERFQQIENIYFIILKENPPMGTDGGQAGIELNVDRAEIEKMGYFFVYNKPIETV